MLAGLARTKILALLLGPEGLGIVGIIDQAVSFLTHFGSLSFPFAALTFLSRRRGEGMAAFSRLYAALLKAMLAVSLIALVAVVSVALWRTEWIAEELIPYRLPLVLGLLPAPALAAAALLRSAFASLERHREATLSTFFSAAGLVVTSYIGVTLGGLTGLYVGNLIVAVVVIPLMTRYLRRSGVDASGFWGADVRPVLAEESKLVEFCATVHLLSLAAPLAYLLARVSVLSHHGATEAGLLYAAYGLALAMRTVLTQANTFYLFPILNQPTDKDVRGETVAGYLRVLMVILIFGALAVVLFPGLAIELLYSARFVGAAAFLVAFIIGEALLLVSSVYTALLIGLDDIRGHAVISVVGHVILAIVVLLAVPTLGALGVAIAFIAGNGVMLASLAARLSLRHGVTSVTRSLPAVFLGTALLGGAGMVVVLGPPLAWYWRVAIYVVAVALALSALDARERAWLRSPLRPR